MIRRLKDDYPYSNIVAIDYDPGATKINQENRIKLMLANAKALSRTQKEHDQDNHGGSHGSSAVHKGTPSCTHAPVHEVRSAAPQTAAISPV